MATNSNPSLQKKTAARTAAVQAVYRMTMTGEKHAPSKQIEHLKKQLSNNRDEQKLRVGVSMEPNYSLLEKILEGMAEFEPDINVILDGALTKQWTRERMGPLLTALLQCGIFELFFYKDTKSGILIDEYTRLARSFVNDADVSFVHATLQTLAKKMHG